MTIEHLCLSGGGPNGFITYGALKVLNKENIWNINNIKSIYGTSIGCLISVLLSLNIEWDILDDYIIKIPLNKFLSFNKDNLFKCIENKGFFDKNVFVLFFKKLFEYKNIDININLLDYYKYNNIELNFISCDINSFTEVNYNYINNPKLKLIDALYRSCCLPFIFKPDVEDNKCFLDGGILNNFPINYILNKNIDSDKILAIKNKNESEINNLLNILEKDDIFKFFYKFSRIIINSLLEKNNCSNKVINLPFNLTLKTQQWNLDYLKDVINNYDLRLKLVKYGEEQALEFYNTDCKNCVKVS